MQDSVLSASVNFMSSTLKAEFVDTNKEDITAMIEGIVNKYEPDVIVIDKDNHMDEKSKAYDHLHGSEDGKSKLIMLIIGSVIFGMGTLH